MDNWFSKHVVPRVKFLREIVEQVNLITLAYNDKLVEELEYKERTFPFRCPNCSSEIRIDRMGIESYDICGGCEKRYLELFYGPQKIFKVCDGNVSWWVSAVSETEAIEEVLEYEKRGGCDLIKEGYWKKDNLEDYACEISIEDARHTTFYAGYGPNSTMWEEFCKDSSTHVIGCSEG